VPFHAEDAQRLEQAQRPQRVGIRSVLGGLEADLHVALRRQVVDLVGLRLLDQADQVGGVGQVAVVQEEARVVLVRIDVEVIDAAGVEGRGAPLDAVHHIALLQQERREIGPILPGHPRDQCDLARHPLLGRRSITLGQPLGSGCSRYGFITTTT
jgi:hypothetical protein